MTLLSHEALVDLLGEKDIEKRLVVCPLLSEAQVGPASIDLRLGTEFLLMRRSSARGVDVGSDDWPTQARDVVEAMTVPYGEPLWLHPGQFVLGSTLEFVRLPSGIGAYVLGRSSWGRVGLLVATAVMVQPGYTGTLTLELVNEGESPIALYPGLRVAQLAVHSLDTPTAHGYGVSDPNYVAAIRPLPAKFDKDSADIVQLRNLGALLEGK